MKRLLLACALFLPALLLGQTPDCPPQTFTLTGNGSVGGASGYFQNIATGCTLRYVNYQSTSGITGWTLAFQKATGTAVPGSFSTVTPTTNTPSFGTAQFGMATINLVSSTASSNIAAPFVRVNVSGASGAGSIQIQMYGYRVGYSASGGGGGGGGGGLNQLTQDVLAGPGTGSQVATVVGTNGLLLPVNANEICTNAMSQIVATGCISAGGGAAQYTSVAFSATPTFTASSNTDNSFAITLTGNVTGSTLASSASGQILNFRICQDVTGGHTFAWPSGFTTAPTISPIASACTKAGFFWDGANARLIAPGTVDTGPGYVGLIAAPSSSPGSGFVYSWCDSTDLDCELRNSAGNIFAMFRTGVDVNPVTGQVTNLSHVTNSSLPNSGLVNPSLTINGATVALGASGNANWTSGAITSGHLAAFTGTAGQILDGGVVPSLTGYVQGAGSLLKNNAVTCGNGAGSVFDCTSSATIPGFTSSGLTTISSAPLVLSGPQSAAAWTTNGIRLKGVAATMTDTSSSGTVAAAYTDVLGGNTIAASSATTYTNYDALYVKAPVAGSNVTFTANYALGADSLIVNGLSKHTGVATFTNQLTDSYTSTASVPATLLSGTWYTGGSATTTKPHLLVECNSGTTTSTGWSTAGTGIGANACSGFTGNLLDLQLNGVSKISVDYGGDIATSANFILGGTNAIVSNGGAPKFTGLSYRGINPVLVGSLPACVSGTLGLRQQVSDATLATPGSTAVGSGTYTIAVQCIFNSTGSAYTWIID